MDLIPNSYTYLLINLASIAIPFSYSFESRISFYRQWRYLFPALAITGLFFIVWDIVFTDWGVWGFNQKYLTGIYLFNLPVEEWLFFICIPYACVFTYQALRHYLKVNYLEVATPYIVNILVVILLVLAAVNYDKAYTTVTFTSLALFLLWHHRWLKSNYLGWFFLSFGLILFPFFLVNGILTGSFLEEEVVWYHAEEFMGIRMFTIPLEDTFYGMLLILMNVTLYEFFKNLKASPSRTFKGP